MTDKKPIKIFGLRLAAIIETVLFLIILVALNVVFGDGKRFLNTNIHPFWIIVLLVTVQYGMAEGLFAVLLSTLFLYVGNIPSLKPDETLFDYRVNLAWLPVMWFIAAFILGQISLRHESEKKELKEKLEESEVEAKTIADAYQNLKAVKENLEVHVAGQMKTTAAIFKSFKALGYMNPSHILMNLATVIVPVLDPQKFSVYFLGPNGFEPATSYGWKEHEKYQRRFKANDPLYQAILGGHKILCIANPEDQKSLGNEGILAAPLIASETHEIFGMLKIEEMEFKELNISVLESFVTLCDLIGISYSNATQYKKLQENVIHSLDTPFFSQNFYKIQHNFLKKLSNTNGFPLAQLHVRFEYHISEETKAEPFFVSSVFYVLLKEILSETALLFHGRRKWMDFIILLPFTSLKESEQIQDRIKRALLLNDVLKTQNAVFETSLIGIDDGTAEN